MRYTIGKILNILAGEEDNKEDDFEIIENTEEARSNFGYCYGGETYTISAKDLQALLEGKQLATTINCGEYSIFINLDNTKIDTDILDTSRGDGLCQPGDEF